MTATHVRQLREIVKQSYLMTEVDFSYNRVSSNHFLPLLRAVCYDNLKLTNVNLSWVKVLKNSNFSVTHRIDEPSQN